MTREARNFEGTAFKQAVYEESSMVKETLSTRVHPFVAEQVERYAETYDLTRTETLELLIETGLEWGNPESGNRAYTVRLAAWREEQLDEMCSGNSEPFIRRMLDGCVHCLDESEPEEPEDDRPVALSARLPPELVQRVVEWGKSKDVSKAVAAEMLIERGLKWDPKPRAYQSPNDGSQYTVELEPEEADLLRRWRLSERKTPCEAFDSLVYANASPKDRHLPVPWTC